MRVQMSYCGFNNLEKLLNRDLAAKIGQGILSCDLMDIECTPPWSLGTVRVPSGVLMWYLLVCGCMYDHTTIMCYNTKPTKTKSRKHTIYYKTKEIKQDRITKTESQKHKMIHSTVQYSGR